MKTYIVGGWVRDSLLSRLGRSETPSDRDWVVVGATPEQMISRGFVPVGSDFPVFLHPKTHEEYALARTERKVGRGYKGFIFHTDPSVTLEDDLIRRDFTINAMALDEAGALHDPYGGLRDLKDGVLRHVSEAFKEDPVRILRAARFCARFPDFKIAPETAALMKEIVKSGETDALVPERSGKELLRALKEKRPSRFFKTISACGLLARSYPKWKISEKTEAFLDGLDSSFGEPERFAAAFLETPARNLPEIFQKVRVPKADEALAELFSQSLREKPLRADSAQAMLQTLKEKDALRRPERFSKLLRLLEQAGVCRSDGFWEGAAAALKSLDMGEIAQRTDRKQDVPKRIHEACLKALQRFLDEFADQH